MGSIRTARRLRQEQAKKRFQRQKRLNACYASPGRWPFIIILDNLKASFNIPKIFRSADAFGAAEIHVVGTSFFDPAPAMGSFKWVPALFHQSFHECYRSLAELNYTFFILEPEKGLPLHDTHLPERSAFIFGHEEFGISFDPVAYPEMIPLKIEQFGRVQSLNVSNAASVVMYEYVRQRL